MNLAPDVLGPWNLPHQSDTDLRISTSAPSTAAPLPTPSHALDQWTTRLGIVSAVSHAALTVLSYGLVGVTADTRQVTAGFLGILADRLSFAGPAVQSYLRGESLGASPSRAIASYVALQLLPALSFAVLLFLLARYRDALSRSTALRLMRWSILFAALSLPAIPVIVQDFWLSPAWGRMVVAGHNPYHDDLTSSVTHGLPFDSYGLKMTYGPLWAVVSTAVMAVARQHTLWAAVLFKLLLAGAWIACLFVIRRLLDQYGPWRICMGLAIFGWIPMSVHEIVAEGHNDVFLVLCLLLWLWKLEQGHSVRAALFLAASVVFKYVTAPLFLLHLLHDRLIRGRSWLASALTAVPAGLLIVGVAALFFRSPESVQNAWQMTSWHAYDPPHAVFFLLQLTRLSWLPLVKLVRLLFPAISIFLLAAFWRAPSYTALRRAAAGILTAILCSLIGHIWPWFLMWPLCLAALSHPPACRNGSSAWRLPPPLRFPCSSRDSPSPLPPTASICPPSPSIPRPCCGCCAPKLVPRRRCPTTPGDMQMIKPQAQPVTILGGAVAGVIAWLVYLAVEQLFIGVVPAILENHGSLVVWTDFAMLAGIYPIIGAILGGLGALLVMGATRVGFPRVSHESIAAFGLLLVVVADQAAHAEGSIFRWIPVMLFVAIAAVFVGNLRNSGWARRLVVVTTAWFVSAALVGTSWLIKDYLFRSGPAGKAAGIGILLLAMAAAGMLIQGRGWIAAHNGFWAASGVLIVAWAGSTLLQAKPLERPPRRESRVREQSQKRNPDRPRYCARRPSFRLRISARNHPQSSEIDPTRHLLPERQFPQRHDSSEPRLPFHRSLSILAWGSFHAGTQIWRSSVG